MGSLIDCVSLDQLEPKCPKCGSLIEYGITTEFRENIKRHVCKKCNYPL